MPSILSKIWNNLSGYKTLAGLLITLLAFLAQWLPEALNAAHVGPDLAAKIGGGIVAVIGILHKFYKLAYGEEPPAK